MRMDTLSAVLSRKALHIRARQQPRSIRVHVRPDLLLSILLVLGGLATAFLMLLNVIVPGFFPSFIGFGLTLTGGILFLIRAGEIN